MSYTRLVITVTLILAAYTGNAQVDSIIPSVSQISNRYLSQVDKKVDRYSSRLTSRTERTLTRLARWEEKIHALLLRTSPETAARLFAPGQPTFASMLEKLKHGEAVVQNYKASYDGYRDKLTTGIKYIATQKEKFDSGYLKQARLAVNKAKELDQDVANSEATARFIKERKMQLLDQGIKYIGNSKYLQKMDKESYYYVETLRNYKELFNDPKRSEETAKDILNHIPAFQRFMQKNSMLSSMFGNTSSGGSPTASLAGLQTRAGVNALIQDRIAAGGPGAADQVRQQLQAAQGELSKLKDRIMKAGGSNSTAEVPDFKPNMQKTKTFRQRLVRTFDLQFEKSSSLLPTTANIGLGIGYKLNDRSVVGVSGSYKLGMGTIQKIRFTHEGIGFRSYIDWQAASKGMWKNIFLTGGYELSHTAAFERLGQLRNWQAWQPAGLVGLTKKLKMRSKYFKEQKVSILYDALSSMHTPVTQPWIFRVGYNF